MVGEREQDLLQITFRHKKGHQIHQGSSIRILQKMEEFFPGNCLTLSFFFAIFQVSLGNNDCLIFILIIWLACGEAYRVGQSLGQYPHWHHWEKFWQIHLKSYTIASIFEKNLNLSFLSWLLSKYLPYLISLWMKNKLLINTFFYQVNIIVGDNENQPFDILCACLPWVVSIARKIRPMMLIINVTIMRMIMTLMIMMIRI